MTDLSVTGALDHLESWKLALRAENKAPGTVVVYTGFTGRYLRWCAEHDELPIRRASLNQWVAGMLDAGRAPATARIAQQVVRRFATWLTAGGEIATDPFPGMKSPRVEAPMVEPFTDDELRALIATCAVPDTEDGGPPAGETLNHRRDEAIIRLMFETAIRSGEVADLHLDDVDLISGLITIRRGKGGRGRVVPIGQDTTEALLRYLGDRAAASSSDAKVSAARCAAAPPAPASTGSGQTAFGTPQPTAGSPPEDPSPASWPSPAGPAPTCWSVTPAPAPLSAQATRLDASISERADVEGLLRRAFVLEVVRRHGARQRVGVA